MMNPDQLRAQLSQHVNDKVTGKCLRCGVRSCRTFQGLWDQLARAGEVMVLPEDLALPVDKSQPWRR